MRKTQSILFPFLFVLILPFQNCSSNFEALSEGLSSSLSRGEVQWRPEDFHSAKDDTLSQQQDCPEVAYRGFKCLIKTLRTPEGQDYRISFRWNRDQEESTGTVIWVLGNNGRGGWRKDFKESVEIQDDYDKNKNIRSVEVEFLDEPKISENDGGYWAFGGGYYSAAQAYMSAVGYIAANLKSGSFMNHVGGSNGTMVAAYALSHFGAGQYIDRFIFHAGPFLPNLHEACNKNHFASFSQSPMDGTTRRFMGIWMYLDPQRDVCADFSGAALNRLSLLTNTSGAITKSYPQNGVHVVMGAREKTEGFGDWILESNLSWYSQIQAAEKTRDVLSHIGHEMHWPSVASYASLGKPSPLGATPSLTFSTTRNGAAVTQVTASTRVYGLIKNIEASSAMGCMAESARIADCENPHNWTALPNADWSYDGTVWRSEFTPQQLGMLPGKTYLGFNINTRTGQRTPLVSLTASADPEAPAPITPPPGTQEPVAPRPAPTMVFSKTYDGGSASLFGAQEVIYGVSKNLPRDGVKGCMQESSQFFLCNDPQNWQSLPNGDWSYQNGEWRARLTITPEGTQRKTYIGFQVNTATGERTTNVSLTIDPPPVYAPPKAAISEGLFMIGSAIYYSNGLAYCYFPSMSIFTQVTGRANADGIRQLESIPSSMKNDGLCQK